MVNFVNEVNFECGWSIEFYVIIFINLLNVYLGESLDLGFRFIFEYLLVDLILEDFIDFGCGNGVLLVCFG